MEGHGHVHETDILDINLMPQLLRPFAVYSMGNGSRQRFYSFVGGKKIKIKIFLLALVGKFGLFSRDFDNFLTENLPTL